MNTFQALKHHFERPLVQARINVAAIVYQTVLVSLSVGLHLLLLCVVPRLLPELEQHDQQKRQLHLQGLQGHEEVALAKQGHIRYQLCQTRHSDNNLLCVAQLVLNIALAPQSKSFSVRK